MRLRNIFIGSAILLAGLSIASTPAHASQVCVIAANGAELCFDNGDGGVPPSGTGSSGGDGGANYIAPPAPAAPVPAPAPYVPPVTYQPAPVAVPVPAPTYQAPAPVYVPPAPAQTPIIPAPAFAPASPVYVAPAASPAQVPAAPQAPAPTTTESIAVTAEPAPEVATVMAEEPVANKEQVEPAMTDKVIQAEATAVEEVTRVEPGVQESVSIDPVGVNSDRITAQPFVVIGAILAVTALVVTLNVPARIARLRQRRNEI